MGVLFRGWRRSIGHMTLVLALTLSGGWVRSLNVRDTFLFTHDCLEPVKNVSFISSNNGHIKAVRWDTSTEMIDFVVSPFHHTGRPGPFDFFDQYSSQCLLQLFGFEFRHGPIVETSGQTATICVVPYAFLVMPLTLVSAYLLLLTKYRGAQAPGNQSARPTAGCIMGNFFPGRRRRIGVVVLALACVFMVGWVRSIGQHETIVLENVSDRYAHFVSFHGSLEWGVVDSQEWEPGHLPTFFAECITLRRHLNELQGTRHDFGRTIINGIDDHELFHGLTFTIWRLPYWAIVLPLTLLSAYLLLTKPSKLQSGPTDV